METTKSSSRRKPSFLTQYFATACSTLGALTMGSSLAYSSPTSAMLVESPNNTMCSLVGGKPLSIAQVSLYHSCFHLGTLFGLVLGGLCLNWIGRRSSMILALGPSTLGWTLIRFSSQSFAMLVIGRTLTGTNVGIIALAVPTYIGEIASPDIRGFLGSGVQLMITVGVLYVYSFGMVQCWQWLALTCWIPSAALALSMIFNKETPTFLLMKNKQNEARSSLQHFRGKGENVEEEMEKLQDSIAYAQTHKATLTDLKKPYIKKPLIISATLNVFKQFIRVKCYSNEPGDYISGEILIMNLQTIFPSENMKRHLETTVLLRL